MLIALQGVIAMLAAALVAVTLLPFSGSHAWWVRMWDFPRVQIAAGLAMIVGLAWTFFAPGPARWALMAAVGLCLVYQLWRIRPFTPLARKEVRFAAGGDPGADVALLAANVLMQNEEHERVVRLIREADPDVVLLMETDRRWIEALAPALERYTTVLTDPRDDCYGTVFATRLEAVEAKFVRLTLEGGPAVFAVLRTANGTPFHFVGLHPHPPVPGDDTEERDTEVLYAARFARTDTMPLVAMGDFNDAAWSDTARRFKHYGRYVDPRVGRGIYASFDANRPLFRCPIDQFYVTENLAVAEFRLGPHIGSDHFPVIARIRVDHALAARLNRPPPPLDDPERVALDARVAAYRKRLADAAPG